MDGNLFTAIDAFASGIVGKVPGCVVAAVDGEGAGVSGHGQRDVALKLPWESDTIFGLDSVTKVFTAIMFAGSDLPAEAPVEGFLPPGTTLPAPVTLEMLANYTSQLPNNPSNFPKGGARDYTFAAFMHYLQDIWKPKVTPGTAYLYSSVAFGLLGYILAEHYYEVADYEVLVSTQLTEPLDMPDTVASPSPAQQPRVAIGYDGGTPQRPLVTASFLGGGGVLRSTGNDMLTFLKALAWREAPDDLVTAIERTETQTFAHTPHAIGLGWMIAEGEDPVYIKDGGGAGFASLLAYCPARRQGLFAAANGKAASLFANEFATLLGYAHADDGQSQLSAR
jgi:CubicO group peptidase (beta-lactamase class C family)